jgi:hypothetical protein
MLHHESVVCFRYEKPISIDYCNCYLHTPHGSRNSLPAYVHSKGLRWNDFLMEHREQRSHFICNLPALARKKTYTITPSALLSRTSPSKLLIYLLTSNSRVLLEKLTGFQLVKKLPAFYGTRRLITAFTSARHLSLSRANSIQSIPHIQLPGDPFNIILPLRLGLPSGLLPSGFPTQPL